MQKQIWEITETDIKNHPVWVFPMTEDEESDEATVQPASELEARNPNTQVIVASEFTDSSGNNYSGYIYWVKPELIEHLQPCMFSGAEAVTFWSGIIEPEGKDIKQLNFPITVSSSVVYGLEKIEKVIEGYYFINQAGDIEVKHVTS